jgi:hypothetical protein
MWKTGGIRPPNAPQLRLAQLAMLLHTVGDLFDYWVLQAQQNAFKFQELRQLAPSNFWLTHYNLVKKSAERPKRIGAQLIANVQINVVAPFVYCYQKWNGTPNFEELPIEILNKIKPENNRLIANWAQNNIFAESALQSQALIELTNSYCKPKKCLTCGLGKQILIR